MRDARFHGRGRRGSLRSRGSSGIGRPLRVWGMPWARRHVPGGRQRRRGNKILPCLLESSSVGRDVKIAQNATAGERSLCSIRTVIFSSVGCRAFSAPGALTAVRARLLIDHTLPSLSKSRSRFSPSAGAGCGNLARGPSFLAISAHRAGHSQRRNGKARRLVASRQ